MFHIISLASGKPLLSPSGFPLLFPDGKAAADAARKASHERGERIQPRCVADDGAWRERERSRFEDGTYIPVVFAVDLPQPDKYPDHFLHVSTERPDMVAYTESPEMGAADRQTRLKVGVYLTRYYSDDLTSNQIRDIATAYTAERENNTLLYAITADEMEEVYETGPRSCMSCPADHFDSSIHPVRVYAAGDLAVAYIRRGESIVTARAVVWPAKKVRSRVYGDTKRLFKLLDDAGYKLGSLDGARMLRIKEGDAFVAPYVDGSLKARDDGEYLIIDAYGDIGCAETTGLTCGGEYCEDCEAYRDPNSFREVYFIGWQGGTTSRHVCECCAEDAVTCEGTNELWVEEDTVTLEDGTVWSRLYFDDNGFICDGSGDAYPNSCAVHMSDGSTWSEEHFEAYGFTCPGCEENFAKADGVLVDGIMMCPDCASERGESLLEAGAA